MASANNLRAGILIVSDTASKDPSTDKSGDVLEGVFSQSASHSSWEVVEVKIVSDNVLEIQKAVMSWADNEDSYFNVIITTGGTGFATRDNTPEAINPLIHRHAPGLVHGMLAASLTITPFALMSRPVAGVRNKTLILTLPGSPKGARENLEAVLKLLPHACLQAAGGDSRQLHVGGVRKLEKEAGVGVSTRAQGGGRAFESHHSHDHGSSAHSHGNSHDHGHGQGGHVMPVRHTRPEANPQSNNPLEGPGRRYRESPYPMLSVTEATNLVIAHSPAPTSIRVPVNGALVGHVLAEDVTATEAVPAFRASIVDGYAVIVSSNAPSIKGVFPIASISHAAPGEVPELKIGEIARITTGAPLPPGASSVVMVEDTVCKSMTEDGKEEKEIEILTDAIKVDENVREIGSDIRKGSVILRKGEAITAVAGELGLLASTGKNDVLVYRPPVVGVLSTGDEVVQHDRPGELLLGEIRDCNRPTVMAAVKGWGFEVVDLGIAADTPGSLEEKLRDAVRKVDVIVTTGGVSMGELDLLKPTIERSLGGTIHFGRVAMKPGKPMTFGTIPFKHTDATKKTCLIFSLPGNPASAIVTLHLFVLPSLHTSSGREPAGLPKTTVTLSQDFNCDPKRPEYHRAVVMAGLDGMLHATSTGMQRSSRVGSFKGANALLCLPADGRTKILKGEKVSALLMGGLIGV
jgi:gephyrin